VSLVNLVSGGLDSTLVGVMTREEGLGVHPLFIDYGPSSSVNRTLEFQRYPNTLIDE